MKRLLFLLPVVLLLAGCSTTKVVIQEEIVAQAEPEIVMEQPTPVPLGIHVIPRLTDDFVKKYKYEDSAGFCVALKVNGQYFNVFRNKNNGVSNDKARGLTGCIPMNQISR